MAEKKKPKPRKVETAGERADRLQKGEREQLDDEAAEDERIDEMIKRNIEQSGP